MNISRKQLVVTSSTSRRAFTLIELLVVITVIALLMGLLIPAVMNAMSRTDVVLVRTEITEIGKALADFKAAHGVYPPSSITLYKGRALWDADPASKAKIQQIWPDFNFDSMSGSWDSGTSLNGAECLVFFLGGIEEAHGAATHSKNLIGFSKSKTDPFDAAGNNRTGPYLEFDTTRLVPSTVSTEDGIFTYLDKIVGQTEPYVYANSYKGRGYKTTDTAPYLSAGPYTQKNGSYWKSQTFQIISPGADFEHGTGGVFDSEASDGGLDGTRADNEGDNITNFHTAELKP